MSITAAIITAGAVRDTTNDTVVISSDVDSNGTIDGETIIIRGSSGRLRAGTDTLTIRESSIRIVNNSHPDPLVYGERTGIRNLDLDNSIILANITARKNIRLRHIRRTVIAETEEVKNLFVYTKAGAEIDNALFKGVSVWEIYRAPAQVSDVVVDNCGAGFLNWEAGRLSFIGFDVRNMTLAAPHGWFGTANNGENTLFNWNKGPGFDSSKIRFQHNSNQYLEGYTVAWRFEDPSRNRLENVKVRYFNDDAVVGTQALKGEYITNSDGVLRGTWDTRQQSFQTEQDFPVLFVLTGRSDISSNGTLPSVVLSGGDQLSYNIVAITSKFEVRSYGHLTPLIHQPNQVFNLTAPIGAVDGTGAATEVARLELLVDPGITETKATVDAYTELDTAEKLYHRMVSEWYDEGHPRPNWEDEKIVSNGESIVFLDPTSAGYAAADTIAYASSTGWTVKAGATFTGNLDVGNSNTVTLNGISVVGTIVDSTQDSLMSFNTPAGYNSSFSIYSTAAAADAGGATSRLAEDVSEWRYNSSTYQGTTVWLRILPTVGDGELVVGITVPQGAGTYNEDVIVSAANVERAQILSAVTDIRNVVQDRTARITANEAILQQMGMALQTLIQGQQQQAAPGSGYPTSSSIASAVWNAELANYTGIGSAASIVSNVDSATRQVLPYTWGSGVAVPSNERAPRDITVDGDGNITMVGATTDSVFTYSNGSWNTGSSLPSALTNPRGIAYEGNGNIWVSDAATNMVYRYNSSTSSWETGIAVPNNTRPSSPLLGGGTLAYYNGVLFLVANSSTDTSNDDQAIYSYANGSWDTGISGPPNTTLIEGIAFLNGNMIIVDGTANNVYQRTVVSQNLVAWDELFDIPDDTSFPAGIATNGDAVIVLATDTVANEQLIYTAVEPDPITSIEQLVNTTYGLSALNTNIGNVADQVWDEALADHTTADTTGAKLSSITSTGATGQVEQDLTSTAIRSIITGVWQEPTGNYTTRNQMGWQVQQIPDADAVADAVWDEGIANHRTSGSTGAKLNDLQLNLPTSVPAQLTAEFIANAVWDEPAAFHFTADTTGKILRDLPGSISSAADIADAVWDEALTGHATAGTTGKKLTDLPTTAGGGTSLTAADVADAVWDEALADHVAANSIGKKISDLQLGLPTTSPTVPTVGQIADAVWDEALSGHATAGTTGKKVADIQLGLPTSNPSVPTAAAIADAVWDEVITDHATAGTTGKRLTDIPLTGGGGGGTSLTQTAFDAFMAAVPDATKNTFKATVPAAPTVPSAADIADAVWDETLADHTTANTIGRKISDLQLGLPTTIPTAPTAASIADAVWDEALSDHTTTGTIGEKIDDLQLGLPTSAAPNVASIADAVWSEALSGHSTAGSAGKKLTDLQLGLPTSNPTIPTIPSATDIADAVWDEALSGHSTTGTTGAKLTDLQLGLPTTSPTVPTVADIADAVWDEVITDHTTTDTTGKKLTDLINGPAASAIADAVWDEAIGDHNTAGTVGEKLTDIPTTSGSSLTVADIADAVWDETLTSHSTAGSAGAVLEANRAGIYFEADYGWDAGFAIQPSESGPQDIAYDNDGNLLLVGWDEDTVFKYENGAWDTGTDAPAAVTSAQGIAVDSNGNWTLGDSGTGQYYRYINGTWSATGISAPPNTASGGLTGGINYDDDDNLWALVSENTTNRWHKIYMYNTSTSTWTGPFDGPDGIEGGMEGIAVQGDDVLVVASSTGKVYRRRGGVWDDGFDIPSAVSGGNMGLAINGDDISIVARSTSRIYTATRTVAVSIARHLVNSTYGLATIKSTIDDLPSAADITDAVWDEDLADHVAADSIGKKVSDLQLGLPTTAAPTVDAIADAVWDEVITGHTTTDTTGKKLTDLQLNLPTSATTAPTVAQIADAVWDEALSGHATAGTAGKKVSDIQLGLPTTSPTVPTVAQIADAVWDEALSGHNTTGTTGEKLTDLQLNLPTAATSAPSTADITSAIWGADLTDYTTAGTTGKKVADLQLNLPTTIPAAPSVPTAASIADAVWDEVYSDHTTADTFGSFMYQIHDGVGQEEGYDWTHDLVPPAAETAATDIAIKPNGDVVLVGSTTNKIYTYANGAWDAGIDGPSSATSLQGIAILGDDYWVVDSGTNHIFRYIASNAAWSGGGNGPNDGRTGSLFGGITSHNNVIYVLAYDQSSGTSAKIYSSTSGTWSAGIDGPAGLSNLQGIGFLNGNLIVVDSDTNKFYTRESGTWDDGVDIPSGLNGYAIAANGNNVSILVQDPNNSNTRSIYRGSNKVNLALIKRLTNTTYGLSAIRSAVDSIPDMVWDETLADHATAGTAGKRLTDIPLTGGGGGGQTALTQTAFNSLMAGVPSGTKDDFKATIPTIPSTSQIADAVWDEVLSEHTTTDTIGRKISDLQLGLPTTSPTVPTVAQIADAVWDEALTGHGTAGTSGKKLTDLQLGLPTTSAPTAASIADAVWDEALSDHTTAGTIGEKIDDLQLGLPTSSPTIPTVGQIADAVWDEALGDHVAADTVGKKISDLPTSLTGSATISASTISDIADAVWDETLADHVAANSVGKKVSDLQLSLPTSVPTAASVADAVWSEALSGFTTAGTAGKQLSDIPLTGGGGGGGTSLTQTAFDAFMAAVPDATKNTYKATIPTSLPTSTAIATAVWGGLYDWRLDFVPPTAETSPTDISIKQNGDILLVGSATNKVYTYSGGSWDAGFDGPSGATSLQGVAATNASDRDFYYIVDGGLNQLFFYNDRNSRWSPGIALPPGTTLYPAGIALDPSGLVLVSVSVGSSGTLDRIYSYDGGGWILESHQPPAGVANIQGLDFFHGNLTMISSSTGKFYTFSNGHWNVGDDIQTDLNGYALASLNTELAILAQDTNDNNAYKIYSATDRRQISFDTFMSAVPGATKNMFKGSSPTATAIADAVWDETLSEHISANSVGKKVSDLQLGLPTTSPTVPTVADIADAVWDEALADHVAADSIGKKISDLQLGLPTTSPTIPSAADVADAVWSEALSGYTTAGTAGKQLSDIPLTGGGGSNTALTQTAFDALMAAVPDATKNTYKATVSTPPTAAAIADAVWDETLADHATAGTTGKKVTDLQLNLPAANAIAIAVWGANITDNNSDSGSFGQKFHNLPEASNIADAVWNEALSSFTTAGSAGKKLTDIPTTAGSTSISSTDISSIADAVWDEALTGHNNTGTTGAKLTLLQTNLPTIVPTAASIADAVWDEALADHTTADTVGKKVSDLQLGLPTNIAAAVWGALIDDHNSDNGSFGEKIYAIPLSSNIADAVWDETLADHTTADTIGKKISDLQLGLPTSVPTAAAIADQVWDEALSDHSTANTAGKRLSDIPTTGGGSNQGGTSASASDVADAVWNRALTGHTTAGTAGKQLSDLASGPTAASIADAVWDEALADHVAANSIGKKISDLQLGLPTADAIAIAVWGAEINNNNSDSGSFGQKFYYLPEASDIADAVWDEAIADHTTADTIGKKISDLQLSLPAASAIAEAVWAADIASNSSDVGSFGEKYQSLPLTGTIVENVWGELITDHNADIGTFGWKFDRLPTTAPLDSTATATAVWGALVTDHNSDTGSFGEKIYNIPTTSPTVPSVADIADAVWDEALSGHATAGTAGKQLSDIPLTGGGGGSGTSLTQNAFDAFMAAVPSATKDSFKADVSGIQSTITQSDFNTLMSNVPQQTKNTYKGTGSGTGGGGSSAGTSTVVQSAFNALMDNLPQATKDMFKATSVATVEGGAIGNNANLDLIPNILNNVRSLSYQWNGGTMFPALPTAGGPWNIEEGTVVNGTDQIIVAADTTASGVGHRLFTLTSGVWDNGLPITNLPENSTVVAITANERTIKLIANNANLSVNIYQWSITDSTWSPLISGPAGTVPKAIAVLPDDNFVVSVENGTTLYHFNIETSTWSTYATLPAAFNAGAHVLATSTTGDLYASEESTRKIYRYSAGVWDGETIDYPTANYINGLGIIRENAYDRIVTIQTTGNDNADDIYFERVLMTESSVFNRVPTADSIADAVWDEQLADHAQVGSTGKKLTDNT